MFVVRKLLLGVALATATALSSAAQADELVVNGGFEDVSIGGAGYLTYSTAPVGFGWTVDGGNVDVVTYGAGFTTTTPAAGGGFQLLDMVGTADGSISQAIATVVGQSYTFSFDYSHNPGVTAGNMGFSVAGDAGFLLSGTIFDNDISQVWSHYSSTFVATNTSTLLSFYSFDTCCNGGIFLDNVSVSTNGAVPEPATWALMITGFGLVGSTLRRRRAIAA